MAAGPAAAPAVEPEPVPDPVPALALVESLPVRGSEPEPDLAAGHGHGRDGASSLGFFA
ncbi:MAG: hypothetical protein ACR2K2_08955 [Mycobacteriales bacterium]